MSNEIDAAIEETARVAKQLLFNRHSKLKGPEASIALHTLEIALPKAKAIDVLNPQEGQIFFDWQGDTHVYNAGMGDLLIEHAEADDSLSDRVLCCSDAIMLDALGDPR